MTGRAVCCQTSAPAPMTIATTETTTSAAFIPRPVGSSGRRSGVQATPAFRASASASPDRSMIANTRVIQKTSWMATLKPDDTATPTSSAGGWPPMYGGAGRREDRDRHDDRQQQAQEAPPLRVPAGPDQDHGAVRVPGGEPLGVTELDEGGALAPRPRRFPRRPVRSIASATRARISGSSSVRCGRRDGAQDPPDVAIGEGAHGFRPPWSRRRIEASIRSQSAISSAARRSPSGLIR